MYEWVRCWASNNGDVSFDPVEGWTEQEALVAVCEDGRRVLAGEYADLRRNAYPQITEQLDAIWKIVAALQVEAPQDAKLVMDKVMAVKASVPKPPDGPWVR